MKGTNYRWIPKEYLQGILGNGSGIDVAYLSTHNNRQSISEKNEMEHSEADDEVVLYIPTTNLWDRDSDTHKLFSEYIIRVQYVITNETPKSRASVIRQRGSTWGLQ
jgi:hypothetical protein